MASNFHLEVGADRLATLTFDSPDKKLNVFTRTALQELETVLQELAGRQDVGCLILLSGKPAGFIAGADVEEIARVTDPLEAEAGSRVGHRLFAAWEAVSKSPSPPPFASPPTGRTPSWGFPRCSSASSPAGAAPPGCPA